MNAPVKTTPSVLYPVVPKPVVRVLVVDDNSNDRELLQARFVKAGMADKVTFVSNGTVAWEMLTSDSEAAHQTLCAVLLDLKMPSPAANHRDLVTVVGSLATVSAGEWITAQGQAAAGLAAPGPLTSSGGRRPAALGRSGHGAARPH